MPHQLRRIVAINVIAAKTGLPSEQIAELDIRGAVLAVGINGVGKTTLLRTVPLFYGATPQQILRGSHRGSMISYTLPSDSSCIVYEYARTSDEDLRCAVMYRRPGEDDPVFYILRGGYEENFFVNEVEEFVTAQEFKARAESAGKFVSQALRMHEYRSVILREKPMTKAGPKLRELALEHSLGPDALYNLGHIAAAMTTEKINFDDLKRIVIDRVSEDAGSRSGDGILSQKQSKDEIKNWIDTRKHLASILSRAPDAAKLLERVESLNKAHLKLCTLHVAVKRTFAELAQQKLSMEDALSDFEKEYRKSRLQLKEEIGAAAVQHGHKTEELDALGSKLKSMDNQIQHYQKINVEELLELQSSQPILQSQQHGLVSQISNLTSKAKDARERSDESKRLINEASSHSLKAISDQREELHIKARQYVETLATDEKHALSQIQAPNRLADIDLGLRSEERSKGGLEAALKNPAASDKTIQALKAAEAEIRGIEENRENQLKALEPLRAAKEQANRNAQSAIEREGQLQQLIADALKALKDLEVRLLPQEGSLLAFLRKHDQNEWAGLAKVLDPRLLERVDLSPAMLDEGASSAHVSAGNVSLDLNRVEAPDWVDMPTLKREIELQITALDQLRTELVNAQASSKSLSKAGQQAANLLNTAEVQLELTQAALHNARSLRENLRRKADQERHDAISQIQQALAELEARIESLQGEKTDLEQKHRDRQELLTKEFAKKRALHENSHNNQLQSLQVEEGSIKEKQTEQLKKAKETLDAELAGAGIDPQLISNLEAQRDALDEKLAKISRNRGEVASWVEFLRDVLPQLPEMRQRHESLGIDVEALATSLATLRTQLGTLESEAEIQMGELNEQLRTTVNAHRRLGELKDGKLKDFIDHVGSVEGQWSAAGLEMQVMDAFTQLAALESDVESQRKSLRGDLLRNEGQASDWLRLKEQELPDPQIVLKHQYEGIWAKMICMWFEPAEHGPLMAQLNKEKQTIFMKAGGFVDALTTFDRNIEAFNKKLRQALSEFTPFESFGELAVTIRSGVGKIEYLKVLQSIQDRHRALSGSLVSLVADDRALPSEDDANLMREYRNVLQGDGGFNINLREQVEMECSLRENNKIHRVTNQEEFSAISSNGLTALITAMFLLGFAQMIRKKDSPVRLTWITDELGRFDAKNVSNFLQTLSACGINVISAAPSADPALAKHFDRLCSFENDGAILTAAAEGVPA